jgi:antitoxin VapB
MPKRTPSTPERNVQVFRNVREQAVRIPREVELSEKDAVVREEGDRFVIEPAPAKSLLAVLAALESVEEEFPVVEELPHTPVDV